MPFDHPNACEHGRLRRSCNDCANAEDIAGLTTERDGLLAIVRKFVDHYPAGLNPWLDEAYHEAREFIRAANSA